MNIEIWSENNLFQTHNATIKSQQAIISGVFKVNENLGCQGADGNQGGKLMIAVWKSCWTDLKEYYHWLLRASLRASGKDVDLGFGSLSFTFPGQTLSFLNVFIFFGKTNMHLLHALGFPQTFFLIFNSSISKNT